MNWDAFGGIGQLIGPICVLATLFYLSTQSKQNSLATENAAADSSPSAGRDKSPETATTVSRVDIWITARKKYDTLNETEKARIKLFYASQIMATVSVYLRYKQGILVEQQWQRQSNWMQAFLETEAGKAVWAEQTSEGGFTQDFIEYCDSKYQEQLKRIRSKGE